MSLEGAQAQVEKENVELKKKLVNLCACNFESLKTFKLDKHSHFPSSCPKMFPRELYM